MNRNTVLAVVLVAIAATAPTAASAYVGIGAGLSAVGSLLAVVAAFLLTIVGFVWYPLKRVFKRRPRGDGGEP